jgi:hypothetical protein
MSTIQRRFCAVSIVGALAISVTSIGFSQTGSYYNYSNGNSYNYGTYGGTTFINGYNFNNGRTWQQRIDQNGNQSGTDSRGNYWQYNSNTGSYYNSNGTYCYGTGAYRSCSK